MGLQSFKVFFKMLASISVKKSGKKKISQEIKGSLVQKRYNLNSSKYQTQGQGKSNEVQKILLKQLDQNDFKRETKFHQDIRPIRVRVEFSEKLKIEMSLPSSLKIYRFNEIIQSYSKLHHKSSPQHHVFSYLYFKNPLRKIQHQQLTQKSNTFLFRQKFVSENEQQKWSFYIVKFIIQNSLLSQKSSFHQIKHQIFESKCNELGELFELWSMEEKLQRYLQNEKWQSFSSDKNYWLSEERDENHNYFLEVNVRYDSVNRPNMDSNYENKKLYFPNISFPISENKRFFLKEQDCQDIWRELSKNYWALNGQKQEEKPEKNKDIYIQEFSQGSADAESSTKSVIRFNQQNSLCQEQNINDFITFDPKQMLDSGRFRSQNKIINVMMKWFNETEIVDYLLLKDLIFSKNSARSNDKFSEESFMKVPLRLNGHYEPYYLLACRPKQFTSIVFRQISKFMKKILISTDRLLSCRLVECYGWQIEAKSANIQKLQKNSNHTLIIITKAPRSQQISLIDFLSHLVQVSNSEYQNQSNKKFIKDKQTSVKQLLIMIFHQVESLINQLLQQKPHRIKDTFTLHNALESLEFWQIEKNQRCQFLRTTFQPQFFILSLFVYQGNFNHSSNSHVCIDTFELIKRVNFFYEGLQQEKFIQKSNQKQEIIQQASLKKLLVKKLKSQFKEIVKNSIFQKKVKEEFLLLLDQKIFGKSDQTRDKLFRNISQYQHDKEIFLHHYFLKTKYFFNNCKYLQNQNNQEISFVSLASISFNSQLFHVEQKITQLGNLISKNIRLQSIQLIDSYAQPKMFFFKAEQSLNIYERETTLKKKKSSQSTSHKNSLDCHPLINVSGFNQSEVFNTIKCPEQKKAREYENKFRNLKENNMQKSLSQKDRKSSQKQENGKYMKRKQRKY